MRVVFSIGGVDIELTITRRRIHINEVAIHSNYDYAGRARLIDEHYQRTGRYGHTRVWMYYPAAGISFNSPVDLLDLRIFARRAWCYRVGLEYKHWTRNEPAGTRPAGPKPFSKHQYIDLLAELEKHGMVVRKGGARSTRVLTDLGADFCKHILDNCPTDERRRGKWGRYVASKQ